MRTVDTGNVSTLNLIEQVRAECRDHPAANAIESESYHVTYAQLADRAATIAINTVAAELELGSTVEEVIFVLFSDADLAAYDVALTQWDGRA